MLHKARQPVDVDGLLCFVKQQNRIRPLLPVSCTQPVMLIFNGKVSVDERYLLRLNRGYVIDRVGIVKAHTRYEW